LELDPEQVISGYSGMAHSCEGAPLGDLNVDTEVDGFDLSGVLAFFGLPSSDETECMDMDRDGQIDQADALQILSRVPQGMKAEVCQDQLDQLEEMVEDHRTCSTDADCQIAGAGCGHVADHCSRVVYVNESFDSTAFNSLARSVADCIGPSSCRSCDDSPPPAACIMGRCAAQ
jgi:hypothetical protein